MALTYENLGFKSNKDGADSGSNSLKMRLGCGVHCRLLVGWSCQGIPKAEQDNAGERWPNFTHCCRKQEVLVWVLVGQAADPSAA